MAAQDPADHGVAGGRAGRLPVREHRRAGHQPQPGLRPGEPDPADLPLRRGLVDLAARPRAGPPVVRRLGVGADAGATSGSTRASRPTWRRGTPRRTAAPAPRRGCAAPTGSSARASGSGGLPVSDPGPDRIFDGAVYDRGGMTLAALRMVVGDATFATLLRTWVERRRHGNGSTADFAPLAEELSGRDLDALLRRLARGAGQARRHRGQRPRLNGSRASRRRTAPSPARRGWADGSRRSSVSATVIARSPALMPSQRSGSGSQRFERCPTHGCRTSVGVVAEHEVAQGPAGQVGGGDAVADVPTRPGEAGPAVEPHRRAPVARDAQRPAPRVVIRAVGRPPGTGRPGSARSFAKTRGSRSNSGRIREPKWYGAPRPPNTRRSSSVRWP